MSKVGFFDAWLGDMNYWEMKAINNVADSVSQMGSISAEGIGANQQLIQKLFALDRVQSRELAQLRAAVKVLADMLIEAGALDETVFRYRLEAETDRLAAEEEEKTAESALVDCYACNKKVPPATTQLDAVGTICDRCFYGTASDQ